MHTSWSHDCSVEVDELLDYAEAQSLGAIAVTDHNAFGGALEAVEKARGRGTAYLSYRTQSCPPSECEATYRATASPMALPTLHAVLQ